MHFYNNSLFCFSQQFNYRNFQSVLKCLLNNSATEMQTLTPTCTSEKFLPKYSQGGGATRIKCSGWTAHLSSEVGVSWAGWAIFERKGGPWGPLTGKTSKETLPLCFPEVPDSLGKSLKNRKERDKNFYKKRDGNKNMLTTRKSEYWVFRSCLHYYFWTLLGALNNQIKL